jgi:hypothetical protein
MVIVRTRLSKVVSRPHSHFKAANRLCPRFSDGPSIAMASDNEFSDDLEFTDESNRSLVQRIGVPLDDNQTEVLLHGRAWLHGRMAV